MGEERQKAEVFELNNGTMYLLITNLGCTITSLSLPDKDGNLSDLVLGFDSLEPCQKGLLSPYFGCIVGRVANRIKEGKFTLDGVQYSLPINNPPNSLHGGHAGFDFDKKVWEVVEYTKGQTPSITFKYHSHDGEEGYPGSVTVTATYTLTSTTTLRLDMEGVAEDKPTLISLAQHTYWLLELSWPQLGEHIYLTIRFKYGQIMSLRWIVTAYQLVKSWQLRVPPLTLHLRTGLATTFTRLGLDMTTITCCKSQRPFHFQGSKLVDKCPWNAILYRKLCGKCCWKTCRVVSGDPGIP